MKQQKGATFCRPEYKGRARLAKTSPRRCPDCKLRIRGVNHNEGEQHKKRVNR